MSSCFKRARCVSQEHVQAVVKDAHAYHGLVHASLELFLGLLHIARGGRVAAGRHVWPKNIAQNILKLSSAMMMHSARTFEQGF